MDYMTNPMSRNQLRELSKVFRSLFNISPVGAFPVLDCLEKMPDIFKGATYEIVEDDFLPKSVPAQCNSSGDNEYCIQIKESVYEGAFKNIGAYRDHITHEMCHVFLEKIGQRPISQRCFSAGELPNYSSIEWQAKALCGELMMPYEETAGLSAERIVEIYGVSKGQAQYRCYHY